jgi:hypothetical protein
LHIWSESVINKEFARSINLETAEYLKHEASSTDIPISVLSAILGK